MQPYNFTDFNKDFNTFRWPHPDIRQSYWTKNEQRYDYHTSSQIPVTWTLSTIRYKDERVMQFYTNDDNNIHNKLATYNTDVTTAKRLGLVSYNTYGVSAGTIIDALYYKANPPNYYNKNGSLKKGFWGWLNRRCRSKTLRASWVTQDMLSHAQAIALSDPLLASRHDNNIIEYLAEKGVYGGFYKDPITTMLHVDGGGRQIRLSSLGYVKIHESTDLQALGYTYNERHNIWLKPNEFFHNGHVYDRSEVSIERCSSCGTEHVSELLVDGVCTNCLDASYKIHNYSTRVEGMLKFKATKVKPNTIYLGCELEYETINREKAQLGVGKLLKGHALMKSDGSIRNGFEIVTCPATLDIHLQVFKSFFDNLPPDLKIEKNVGMHVHISRKPLSELTLGKMTEFLNRDENKDFIHHIAGRINNNYARMEKNRTVTFAWRHKNGSDRYNALNLTNQNTVEVRLFATPMDYKTFAMRLQFCQALVDYCQPGQSSASLKQQTHYKEFINWMHGNRKTFPDLYTHLKGIN